MIDPHWADDPNVAPYVWEASVNGILRWVEYPPQFPQTRFVDIGFTLQRRNGVRNGDVHTYVNDTPMTVRFRALPLRPAAFPNIEIDIEPGDALVWTHRGVMTQNLAGGALGHREAMLFGRESRSGEITLMQAFPDGSIQHFSDYRSAMEHPV
jgi:hypothetical protein